MVTIVDAQSGNELPFAGREALPGYGGESYVTNPTWSPDGTHIALEDGFVIHLAQVAAPIASTFVPGSDPDWSPDGDRIVFVAAGGLYVVRTKVGEPAILLTHGVDLQPAWSPDGEWVAFSRAGDLWRVPAAGGEPLRITEGAADDREPTWSPDGELIAFASDRGGAFDIWVVRVANGRMSQLTNDAAADGAPDWSPDGTKIAFVSTDGGYTRLVIASDLRTVGIAPMSWSGVKSQYR